ncbi:hypothetical protein ETH_00035945, partial [Eimeria tenella]
RVRPAQELSLGLLGGPRGAPKLDPGGPPSPLQRVPGSSRCRQCSHVGPSHRGAPGGPQDFRGTGAPGGPRRRCRSCGLGGRAKRGEQQQQQHQQQYVSCCCSKLWLKQPRRKQQGAGAPQAGGAAGTGAPYGWAAPCFGQQQQQQQ